MEIIQNAHLKWFAIGMKLKMPMVRLRAIRQQHGEKSTNECFNVMIKEWLDGNPDLGLLVAELRQRDFPDIAEKLEGKHYYYD